MERDADRGRGWAFGFNLGVMLRGPAWTRLTRNRKAGMLLDAIVALAEDEVSPDVRWEIIERLPGIVLAMAGFWRRAGPLAAQPADDARLSAAGGDRLRARRLDFYRRRRGTVAARQPGYHQKQF